MCYFLTFTKIPAPNNIVDRLLFSSTQQKTNRYEIYVTKRNPKQKIKLLILFDILSINKNNMIVDDEIQIIIFIKYILVNYFQTVPHREWCRFFDTALFRICNSWRIKDNFPVLRILIAIKNLIRNRQFSHL